MAWTYSFSPPGATARERVRQWPVTSDLPREAVAGVNKHDFQDKAGYRCFISPAQHTTTTGRRGRQQSKAEEGFQSRWLLLAAFCEQATFFDRGTRHQKRTDGSNPFPALSSFITPNVWKIS